MGIHVSADWERMHVDLFVAEELPGRPDVPFRDCYPAASMSCLLPSGYSSATRNRELHHVIIKQGARTDKPRISFYAYLLGDKGFQGDYIWSQGVGSCRETEPEGLLRTLVPEIGRQMALRRVPRYAALIEAKDNAIATDMFSALGYAIHSSALPMEKFQTHILNAPLHVFAPSYAPLRDSAMRAH